MLAYEPLRARARPMTELCGGARRHTELQYSVRSTCAGLPVQYICKTACAVCMQDCHTELQYTRRTALRGTLYWARTRLVHARLAALP